MATDCGACPLRRKELFAPMSESDVAFMRRFKIGEMEVEAGTTLLLEGASSPQLFTALDGMGIRYKTLADGRRQVISFIQPGDFIGLQSGVMGSMQHSVEASTAMTLCVFRRDELMKLFRDQPERAFDITWLAAVEEHFLGDTIATLGKMTARERVARSFLKFIDRADALGTSRGTTCALPYTQQDLADALGLSLVHTNKTLKSLRDEGLASWRKGRLTVQDYDRLRDIAQDTQGLREEMIRRPLI